MEHDAAPSPRKRLVEVDRVTGFAIVLVVVGHIVAREPPVDHMWWMDFKYVLYRFHMPLFMFLSGLVFGYTYRAPRSITGYWELAAKRFRRLAPGFLLLGVAITLGKALAAQVVHVDNLQGAVSQNLVKLLVDPSSSVAGSLWYIYVLLELSLLMPLLYRVVGGSWNLVMVVGAGLHAIHLTADLPSLLMIDSVFEYALWFSVGAAFAGRYREMLTWFSRSAYLVLGIFASSFLCLGALNADWAKLVVGAASIPAILVWVGLADGPVGAHLSKIGSYTYTIYLFNTICIGVTKAILLKVLPWDGWGFYFYMVVLGFAGLYLPIVAHKVLLRRVGVLGRITR